jgi:hypothetical protein
MVTIKEHPANSTLLIALSQIATSQSNPNQFNVRACKKTQHSQQPANIN